MKKTQWITALFSCAIATVAQAAFIDAQIVHIYDLAGDPNDSLGGPPLTLNPGSSLQGGGGIAFGPNAGPSAGGAGGQNLFGFSPVADYSVEFSFQFDSSTYFPTTTTFPDPFGGPATTLTSFPFVKVLDFADRTVDPGLYINNEGVFEFRTHGSIGFVQIQADIEYHIVFARSNDLGIQLYVDGAPQFDGDTSDPDFDYVDDLTGQARIDLDALHLFLDDNETTDPMAGGILNFARLYTGTLTPDEVANLVAGGTPPGLPASIPVPGALLLMVAGLPLLRRRIKT